MTIGCNKQLLLRLIQDGKRRALFRRMLRRRDRYLYCMIQTYLVCRIRDRIERNRASETDKHAVH